MADALVWFLTLELLGAAALPWAYCLFRFLPDRGLTLAKPAVLLLLSYGLWLLGLLHLLPNTALTVWAIFLCLAAGSAWLVGRRWEEMRDFLRQNWPVLLIAELVFAAMFLGWALVVSGSPGITHTEKPMDFMLLNAAHQARYFPAEDPWLSGHSISYYYFGHVIMATLSKMSGVATSVGYNLAVATLPALAGAACFGLLYNLVRLAGGGIRWALSLGASAPALILLTGNLMGALEFVRLRAWAGEGFWNWAGIEGLKAGAAAGGAFPAEFWWWFRSTRVIGDSADGVTLDYTITEFPAFSFLLGDLHAHVLAIPFLLLAVGAILNLYASGNAPRGESAREERPYWLRRYPAQAAAVALSGGALAFINFWDFPTFLAILAAALLLKGCRDHPGSLLQAARAAASAFLPIFLLSVALFAPAYLIFGGQTSGVLPLRDVATHPFHLFIVLGLFILPSLALLARMLLRMRRPEPANTPVAVAAILLAAIPLGLWMATAFMFTLISDGAGAALSDLGRRLTLALPAAIVVAAAAYCAARLSLDAGARQGGEAAASFVLLLLALGFFLVMVAELFHIVDSFGGAWRRMNTVFKVYYQAWLLLGIAASFAVYGLWAGAGRRPVASRTGQETAQSLWRRFLTQAGRPALQYGGAAAMAFLLAASFYYTIGAALDRSGANGPPPEGRTLDGLAYLRSENPGEYAAIAWLRDEAPPGRIVEAVGDDYSRYGNISAATGLPTLLGWKGHELQWRGSSEPFAGREEDVAAIYSGQAPAEARRLLNKYGVRYVYLGNRERERYGVSELPEYRGFLKTVFRQDGVIVYELWNDPGP